MTVTMMMMSCSMWRPNSVVCSSSKPRAMSESVALKENSLGLQLDRIVNRDEHAMQRRHVAGHLLALLVLATTPTVTKSQEATLDLKLYSDEEDKFSLMIPQDWVKGEGKARGQRKVTAFFPESDGTTNVNVIITGLGADYTGLGSFGNADAFAEKLVNSLDRGWKKPPGPVAKLIDSKSKNGLYYVEYTLQNPGERKRHFLSAAGIGFNGWINRLYTVTAQFWDDDIDKYRQSLEKVVLSLKV